MHAFCVPPDPVFSPTVLPFHILHSFYFPHDRSGDIEVSCTVTVNGATGSAQTAVTLEGAPICANPNGCLIVT
eukprot:scaffold23654_cov15-Tisochrysis_lutea.AAC.1